MSSFLTLEKSFEEYGAEADALFNIHGPDAWRYYEFIPSQIVNAHPEGGCMDLVTNPSGKYGAKYSRSGGAFCWPGRAELETTKIIARRPEMFIPQEDAPKGSDIFRAFYGEMPRQASVFDMYENFDNVQLSGFFGSIKRMVTPPRAVRSFVGKGLRYAGAAQFGTFMPAGMRQKMFGLSERESKNFEKYSKVARGTMAAAAVVVTGGAALPYLKGAPLAKAGASGYGVLRGSGLSTMGMGMAGAGAPEWLPTSIEAASNVGKLSAGQSLITKTIGGVLKFAKDVGGQMIVSKFNNAQIPEAASIPAGGIILDESYDDRPYSTGLPAFPAGGSFPPLGIEDAASIDDFSLKDAVASEEPKQAGLGGALAVAGLAAVALYLTRKRV